MAIVDQALPIALGKDLDIPVAVSSPPPPGIQRSPMDPPMPTVSTWENPYGQSEPHAQAEEIIRQVEFYFGDENLPGDAHLLALAGGDGNGPVHRRDILSFRKMKPFRPWSSVKAALKQSTQVEIVGEQFIKRRYPLTVRLRVQPRPMPERTRKSIAIEDPTYSKNMLKPTGFEPNATQGPITPAEYEEDRTAFDLQESFAFRMENAVNRYNARRKMHQETLQVFHRFIMYGGFEGGRQFTGGANKKQMVREGLEQDEIDRMTAYFGINAAVRDEFIEEDEHHDGDMESKWVVDFEGIARGFLSNQFMTYWDWYVTENITLATNVLRNFYGYLLLHDVCPEYEQDILQAQDVCDIAKEEFEHLAVMDQKMPGNFSVACSTLFGGHFAALYRTPDENAAWTMSGDNIGMSQNDARLIFMAAMTVYGSPEQCNILRQYKQFRVISSEEVGLEVVRVEQVAVTARQFYDDPKLKNTVIRPMGKLFCKRWKLPFQAPRDLPKWKVELDKKREDSGEELEFFLDDDLLRHCHPGFKMAATVTELDIGVRWIDRIDHAFPSFYVWLPNEYIADYKEPGPPKSWMVKANMRATGVQEMEPPDLAEGNFGHEHALDSIPEEALDDEV